jgi:16S rRNA (cytosine967-C5)-methyltransferase
MIPSKPLFSQAAHVLKGMLDFTGPADAVLSRHFRDNRELGPREREFVAETCYAVLRHKRLLELAVGEPTPRLLVLATLIKHQGLSVRELEPLLKTGEREQLGAVKAFGADTQPLAVRAGFPDWLADRLVAQYGEADTLALGRALLSPAPLDLRVNPQLASREEALTALAEDGIGAEATAYSPLGLRLKKKLALQKHPLFVAGKVEVQDEGSQLLGYLVGPRRGEMVADFCAGAGGKTLLLGALMANSGRLYAFDVSEKRLAQLKPRLARSGLSNVHPQMIAHENDTRIKRLAGKMDRVLVDAPCSGLGTLRRNPDLKWRQTGNDIAELSAKQLAILLSASRLVKPGGRLVYATCSLLAEENEQVVQAFLEKRPDFVVVPAARVLAEQRIPLDTGDTLKLLPQVHGTDGFFACVMERSNRQNDRDAEE